MLAHDMDLYSPASRVGLAGSSDGRIDLDLNPSAPPTHSGTPSHSLPLPLPTDADMARILATGALHEASDDGVLDDGDWLGVESLDAAAFGRALQEAAHTIDDSDTTGDHTETQQDDIDGDAFAAWAQRIARMRILNVDGSIDDSDLPSRPVGVDPALPLSLTSDSPQSQLLRYKIMLAQEEARNVDLEDRLQRLTHELARSHDEIAALRHERDLISSKYQQHLATSTGCAIACQAGTVRIENEALKTQNQTLRANIGLCEKQMKQLMHEMGQSQRLARPSNGDSTESSSPAGAPALSPLSPSSSSVSAASLSLLRVRSTVSLARLSLKHQDELNHLLQFKVHHLTLQNTIDDLENSLDIERELLAVEQTDHARAKARVQQLEAESQSLQVVVAQLSQGLQKYVGSQGMGMSVSMNTNGVAGAGAGAGAAPHPIDDGSLSSASGSSNPLVTPLKGQSSASAPVQIGHLATPAGVSSSHGGSGGGGGWGLGLGWVFGSGGGKHHQHHHQHQSAHAHHRVDTAAEQAAEQARQIMKADADGRTNNK